MLPEIGHFLLILATATALAVPGFVLWGAHRGRSGWMNLWKLALPLACLELVASAATLVWAFLTDDFSVAYVARNSNTHLATVYKVAAFWGSHEGSMFLWTLLTALAALVAARPLERAAGAVFAARTQALMLLIAGGFGLFMVFTSNPFLRTLPYVPLEGKDLNPILQDIGMVLHPPVLFAGYSAMALCFAAAIALMLQRRWNAAAERVMGGCTLVAWIFLTAGNALGSWWAYNELGWGGWWFWDPVENASFIPWLVSCACLHALLQVKNRGQLRAGALFLSLTGFAMALFGSFVVRSGAMQSVHAFAADPNRGMALAALTALLLVPALVLFIQRGLSLPGERDPQDCTALDGLMLGAVLLLASAAACVFFGTVYPMLHEAFGGAPMTVGAPYFNSFFVPMAGIGAFLAGAAQLGFRSIKAWIVSAALAAAALAAVLLTTHPADPWMAAAGTLSAAWLVATAFAGRIAGTRLRAGVLVAHIGIAVSIVGATGVSQYESEALVRMGPGAGRPVADVIFVCTQIRPVSAYDYTAAEARIAVLRGSDEKELFMLAPQRRRYHSGLELTKAGIRHGALRDLYVSLGNRLGQQEYLVRLTVKPLAGWIWTGAAVMIVAGAALLAARRRRRPCPK